MRFELPQVMCLLFVLSICQLTTCAPAPMFGSRKAASTHDPTAALRIRIDELEKMEGELLAKIESAEQPPSGVSRPVLPSSASRSASTSMIPHVQALPMLGTNSHAVIQHLADICQTKTQNKLTRKLTKVRAELGSHRRNFAALQQEFQSED